MKLKPLILTVVILGGIIGVGLVLQKSKKAVKVDSDSMVDTHLLTQEEIAKVDEITYLSQGAIMNLKKSESGDWVIPDAFNLPLDFSQLSRLVDSFKDAIVARKVTADANRMKSLEFTGDSITFKSKSGDFIKTINLGKTAQNGRYVRFNDTGAAYLSDLSAWLNTDTQQWLDRKLPTFSEDSIKSINFTFPDADALTVMRENAESDFTVDGLGENESLNLESVQTFLNGYANLIYDKAHALDNETAAEAKQLAQTYTFTLFDDSVYTFEVGRRPEKVTEVIAEGAEEPTTETEPAGPAFLFAQSTNPDAKILEYTAKAQFEIPGYQFERLTQKRADLVKVAAAEAVEETALKTEE